MCEISRTFKTNRGTSCDKGAAWEMYTLMYREEILTCPTRAEEMDCVKIEQCVAHIHQLYVWALLVMNLFSFHIFYTITDQICH